MSQDTSTQFEEWRDIPGYEGMYQVSNLGQVRSIGRIIAGERNGTAYRRFFPGRTLKATPDKQGYLTVSLSRENRKKYAKIHALVLHVFVGNRPEDHDSCHNNGDPADNRLVNLRYGTKVENMADKKTHGRNFNLNKEKCPRGHVLKAPNLCKYEFNKRGHRRCLSCKRAFDYVASHSARNWNKEEAIQIISDQNYLKLSPPEVINE